LIALLLLGGAVLVTAGELGSRIEPGFNATVCVGPRLAQQMHSTYKTWHS